MKCGLKILMADDFEMNYRFLEAMPGREKCSTVSKIQVYRAAGHGSGAR